MSVNAPDDWYAKNLADLRLKPNASEADVSAALVRPVLESVLGFGILDIDAEPANVGGQRLRPDFICGKPGAPVARVIFEVKKLDADLQRRVDKAWSSAPAGQLHRYLLNHARSGTGTWGVLTNGTDWVVVQRGQGTLKPWEFGVMQSASTLKDVRALLADITRSKPPTTVRSWRQEGSVDWLDALASCESPQAFLARVAPEASLTNAAGAAFAKIAEHPTEGEMLPTPTHLACLEIDLPDGHLAPQDISERLRSIPGLVGRVVGVAYTRTREGSRAGRAFLRDGHSLLSTALVEPELPGSRAADQFAALAVHAWDASPVAMRVALSSVPLHREFHEEIAEWFSGGLTELDERQRGNRLRHLIRVMFAWLLQVRGVLPDDALWLPTREPRGKFTVHQHLTWLFTDVLAKPIGERASQKDPWRQSLVQDAPFLNGSLFSELQPRERVGHIENDAYLGNGGLLSILSSYAWTLSDRTGYESESAVDPSMLGEMFERLMIEAEGKRKEGSHLKMPGGTYYTPQDIADEMAADAIAGRLCSEMPNIDWHDARTVVHPSPKTDAWKAWARATKGKVLRLLSAITVFDPCCGSGVFTLAILHALWRAKGRLSREKLSADDLEDIIERQLYAVDVHPTAVLITRLRLFIALVDARTRHGQSQQAAKPLPNLETRCMAANTLCVDPKGQASVMGPEWNKGIGNLRAAREAWTRAHYPDEKQFALWEERTAREQLACDR